MSSKAGPGPLTLLFNCWRRVADHACFFLPKEYDDEPVAAPVAEEIPANDESSFSMQPVLIFLVLVAVIGFYISRRRSQQQKQDLREDKEFNA